MKSAKPNKDKNKKVIILSVITTLLILLVGGLSFLLLSKDKREDTQVSTSNKTNNTKEEITKTTKTLSINYPKSAVFDGNDELGGVFTIEAPLSWQVYKGDEESREGYEGDFKAVTYYIGDPESNYHLQIRYGIDGLGGGCDPNQDEYTLDHKLLTKIDGYFWTEYSSEKGIVFEHYRTENTDPNYLKHTKLKVGESNTDTCNLYIYPTLPTYEDQPVAFLQISAGSAKDKGQVYPNSDMNDRVSYEELSSDKDFLAAIQTVNYTK